MKLDHPEATPAHHTLAKRLQGKPEGMTRKEICDLLDVGDRAARQIIEDLRRWAVLPILCDRGDNGRIEGRYRVATDTPEDMERVNRELNSLTSYGISALESAKGLRLSYQQTHNAGSLFLADVPEPEAA